MKTMEREGFEVTNMKREVRGEGLYVRREVGGEGSAFELCGNERGRKAVFFFFNKT